MFHNQNCECMVFFCDFKKEEQVKIQSKIKEQQQKNPVTMKTPNQPNRKKTQTKVLHQPLHSPQTSQPSAYIQSKILVWYPE